MLVAPMVCWLLAAATTKGRLVGAAILGCLAAAQWVMIRGWLGHALQLTTIAVLAVFVILVLMIAPVTELRFAGGDRGSGGVAKARMAVGWILGFGYCALSLVLIVVISAVLILMGRYAWVPSADAIDPLPDGLSVDGTTDTGCVNRSSDSSCDREFVIRGSGGQTSDEIATRVRQHLRDAHGWTFTTAEYSTRDARRSWKGDCRMEGWALDRHDTCLWVAVRNDDRVTVRLSYLDDW